MKALRFLDGHARIDGRVDRPLCQPGWARIQVTVAGVCGTDLQLLAGYGGFSGVPGHEFVGRVLECDDASWVGERVVGGINAGCSECETCRSRGAHHCPDRRVLGIVDLDGCLAEECLLPAANLHRVPPELSDDQAVFAEPVAAACRILEQVPVAAGDRALVLGDGRLGILCAWALARAGAHTTLLGRHPHKLSRAAVDGLETALHDEWDGPPADVVVEATGRSTALTAAMELCRDEGTVVLKTTGCEGPVGVDTTAVVVRELRLVGSRCGRMADGLGALASGRFPVERLIDARYPLDDAVEALGHAGRPGVLKVLVDVGGAGLTAV